MLTTNGNRPESLQCFEPLPYRLLSDRLLSEPQNAHSRQPCIAGPFHPQNTSVAAEVHATGPLLQLLERNILACAKPNKVCETKIRGWYHFADVPYWRARYLSKVRKEGCISYAVPPLDTLHFTPLHEHLTAGHSVRAYFMGLLRDMQVFPRHSHRVQLPDSPNLVPILLTVFIAMWCKPASYHPS